MDTEKESKKTIRGKIKITPKGFGFIELEDNDKKDLYIPAKFKGKAFSGDYVEAELMEDPKDKTNMIGKVIDIIEREKTRFVGLFKSSGKFGFVKADYKSAHTDFFIPESGINGAGNNDKVVIEFTGWMEKKNNPAGEVVEIIGAADEPGVDLKSILYRYNLTDDFPQDVIDETESMSLELDEEEMKRRSDFRSLLTFSIDGPGTTVRDDALSVEKTGTDSVRVYVHIADPAAFINTDGTVYREAGKRFRSIYMPGKAVPMLPSRIGEFGCSLDPGEEKPAMTVILNIDSDGSISDYEICESVIKPDKALVYDDINSIMEKYEEEGLSGLDLSERDMEIFNDFLLLTETAGKLEKASGIKGKIDFNFPDREYSVDSSGKITDLYIREVGVSEKTIAEFMMAANRSAAEFCSRNNIPCIYRIQELEDESVLDDFRDFVKRSDLTDNISGKKIESSDIQEIKREAEGTSHEWVTTRNILNIFQKSRYSLEGKGHFSLAEPFYCQFTSPLRRFSDLAIHYSVKEYLTGKKYFSKTPDFFKDSGIEWINDQDRKISSITKEAERIKEAEYMESFKGTELTGQIFRLFKRGILVQLENGIRGIVPNREKGSDLFSLNADRNSLTINKSGIVLNPGETVKVKVKDTFKETGEITLKLCDETVTD